MKILLIDDNDEIREVMIVYCDTQKDIDCQVANTGREGLKSIRNDKFDLVLLDIAMPEFSGQDVVESLKQDGLLESMNVVIFTASSNQKLFNEMKNTGVKDVFKKPFSLDELTALIEKYRPKP